MLKLASEVLSSVKFAVIISISSFITLILLFTMNIVLTIVGTICMAAIFSIALCLKLKLVDSIFDLLDIVVLIAVIGMLVDFPIHVLLKVNAQSERRTKTLSSTLYNLRKSIVYPLILVCISGWPLLSADLILLRKTGIYIIIISIISYATSLYIMPILLELYYLRRNVNERKESEVIILVDINSSEEFA